MKQNINKDSNQTQNNSPTFSLDLLLCSLFYVLACAYVPLAIYLPMLEWVSAVLALGICVAGIFVLYRIARTFTAVASYAIILGIIILFGGTLLPIGMFSAFVAATCVFAHMALAKRSPIIWGLPLIPLMITLLLFRAPAAIILSISTLPCSLLLAYSVKKKLSRVGAVCRISFGICISLLAIFCAAVWSVSGELTVSAARALIDALREQTVVLFNSALGALGGAAGMVTSDVKNLVDVTVASMFNLLPALIITFANIVSYIIHSLFLSVSFTTEEERKDALPMIALDMSLTSAIVYFASFALSFILVSESTALYGSAAENMLLILAPGLILTALGAIREFTAKKASCLGTLLYFAVIFMLVSLSAIAIIAVSFAGAVLLVLAHIAKRRSDKTK